MASIDLIKASNGSGPAMQSVLTSSRVIGSNNLVVNNTINYPDKFIAELGTIDPATNQIDPNTIQIVKVSRVDATNLVIDAFAPGYDDLGNSVGDVVLIRPTTEWANNIFNVLSESHNDDGTLKTDAVTTDSITDGAVTADKVDFATFKKPKTIEITLNSSTGTQTITGVGFKASHATTFSQGAANLVYFGSGVATQDGASVVNKGTAIRSEGSSGNQTLSDAYAFLHVTGGGSGMLRGAITGFTNDGFTINITTMATSSFGPRQWVVTLYP